MDYAQHFVFCFGSLFAILNPLATIPPFVALTKDDERAERMRLAFRGSAIACLILIAFSFLGMTILDFFGISLAAFKITGGIILFQASLDMVQGNRKRITPLEQQQGIEKDDISITPLAFPLLAGPATIVTGVLLGVRSHDATQSGIMLGTILLIYLLTFVLLRLAAVYSHLAGELTIKVISRIMGLLLAALAVQFVVNGIKESGLFTG